MNVRDVSDGTSGYRSAYWEFVIDGTGTPMAQQVKTWAGGSGQTPAQLRQACIAQLSDDGRQGVRGASWAWAWTGEGGSYAHVLNPNENPCYNSYATDWLGNTLQPPSRYACRWSSGVNGRRWCQVY